MGLFHTVSDKEILAARKRIVLDVGIPALMAQGFARSPFRTAWFGYYPGNDMYSYQLCRLRGRDLLECLEIMVVGRERWIRIQVNVFRLHPEPGSLDALSGLDGSQFMLPPNSESVMRLRMDDKQGPPIFRLLFGEEHRLGSYFTRGGFERRAKELSLLIEKDMKGIDAFIGRWHQIHKPKDVDWTGHALAAP